LSARSGQLRKTVGSFIENLFSKINNFVSRRLAEGKLAVQFRKPWNFLAQIPANSRRPVMRRGKLAPSSKTNALWWGLLKKVRTFFTQNPD